jgi:hypothetical protein
VLGQEAGHSGIYFRSDRRTPHHRRCRNLTVGASPSLAAGYSGLECQEAHTVLEAHARTVVDRSREKTSSQFAKAGEIRPSRRPEILLYVCGHD